MNVIIIVRRENRGSHKGQYWAEVHDGNAPLPKPAEGYNSPLHSTQYFYTPGQATTDAHTWASNWSHNLV